MSRAIVRLLLFALITVLPSAKAKADPIFVDFESFSSGDDLTNQIPGVTFANATILTAGISLNEIDFPPASGVNVVFDNGGPLRIDFLSPALSFGARFTYVAPLALQFFDGSSNLLGSLTSAFAANFVSGGDAGSSPNELLQGAFNGMAYVTIAGDPGGGSFTMDDLAITPIENRVPEPGTLSMVLVGTGAVFARSTRSRRRSINPRC